MTLLEVFRNNNVTEDDLFTEEFVNASIRNGTLPNESRLQVLDGVISILLPDNFTSQCNASCTSLAIINQTQDMDYELLGIILLY